MPRPLSPGRLLLRLLDDAATPVIAFDLSRRILFVSRLLCERLGADSQQLVGRRLEYTSGGDDPLAAALAGLCPPPEAFSGQASDGVVLLPALKEHTAERRTARYLRLEAKEAGDGLLLVVVLHQDADQTSEPQVSLSPQRLHALLTELRGKLGRRFSISQLLGESDAMVRVREQVRIAAEARSKVLVIGPQGSGREHVARTIHYGQAGASAGPLIPIDCPLVDAEEMQAALARMLRRQYDSPADPRPAALLLDVDRLRPDAQQELAGFLHLPNIELHTLATSRVALTRLADKGKFRPDLAFALSTLSIVLPPLRRRREDIPLLAQFFLEETSAAGGKPLSGFQPAAMERLAQLPWPGNIDELARAVREACQRAAGPQITLRDLPDWVHLAFTAAAHSPRNEQPIRLDDFLADIEKELLARALRAARGNKSKAAQLLGINRPRLLRRLVQLGLVAPVAEEEPVVFEPLPEDTSP